QTEPVTFYDGRDLTLARMHYRPPACHVLPKLRRLGPQEDGVSAHVRNQHVCPPVDLQEAGLIAVATEGDVVESLLGDQSGEGLPLGSVPAEQELSLGDERCCLDDSGHAMVVAE